ncbi:MAG TPA: DUF3618 domain-containing protein [Solirubrobacteraceae bacterium]|nr:DUF3618 domain-containing protein [Solirubrobacteraceae bacterium]
MSASEQDPTKVATSTSTGNGALEGHGPTEREALLVEIEETREELGATVEALAHKADVKAQVHEKVEEGREQLHVKQRELQDKLRDALQGPAVPAAIAVIAGLMLLRSWRRGR